ncbi:MAG: hypothetical protein Q7S92_01290 [Candidatus Diapherotrites archaeon]|nr:hypothetical protein [Candidatus Diapherotrites archaeon]
MKKPIPFKPVRKVGLNVERTWQKYSAMRRVYGENTRTFRPHRLALFNSLVRKQIPLDLKILFDAVSIEFEKSPRLANPREAVNRVQRFLRSHGASPEETPVRLRSMIKDMQGLLDRLTAFETQARVQQKRLMAKGRIQFTDFKAYSAFVAELKDQVETRKRFMDLLARELGTD